MRRTLITLILGAVLICATDPSFAVINEKGWEVGFHGGIQSGDSDASVASDDTFGVKIGFALTPRFELEFAYDRFDSVLDVTGFVGPSSSPLQQIELGAKLDTRYTYYSIGLTSNFLTETDSKTLPYLSVGIGSVEQTVSGVKECSPVSIGGVSGVACLVGIERKDTGTLLTIGSGARTFFTDWFGVRYEARYYHHDSFELNQDAFELSVGGTFTFGGRR